jgi:hypothetical protein
MKKTKTSPKAQNVQAPKSERIENPLPTDSGPYVNLSSLAEYGGPIRITDMEIGESRWGERLVMTVDTRTERGLILSCAPTEQRRKLYQYWLATKQPVYARVKRVDNHFIFVRSEAFDDEEIPF